MKPKPCPGCESVFQPFFAKTDDDAEELELDVCQFCGGAFLKLLKLSFIVGHELKVKPLSGKTDRRCPECTITLQPAELGAVHVDMCRNCTGIYLDDGELHAIAGREVLLRTEADRVIEIACSRCQKRHPAKEAIDDPKGGGLLCASCGWVPKPNDPKAIASPEVEKRRGYYKGGRWNRAGEGYDLFDAIAKFLGTFRRL